MYGNPEPEVTIFSNWTKTTAYSGMATGVVTVHSEHSSCEDTGPWLCTASNYLNKDVNATQTANVTVYCEYNPFMPSVPYVEGTLANSVDPDQTPQNAASYQDLYRLP